MKKILLGCSFIFFSLTVDAELIQLDFSFDNVTWSENIYDPAEQITYGGMNPKEVMSSGVVSAVFDTEHPIFRQHSSDQNYAFGRFTSMSVGYDAGDLSASIKSDWKEYFLSHQLDNYDYQHRNHTLWSYQSFRDFHDPMRPDLFIKNIDFADGFHQSSFGGYVGDVDSGNYTEIHSYFSTFTLISIRNVFRGAIEQPQFLAMEEIIDAFKTGSVEFQSSLSSFTTHTTYSSGEYQSQILLDFKEEQYNGQLDLITVIEPQLFLLFFFSTIIIAWHRQRLPLTISLDVRGKI